MKVAVIGTGYVGLVTGTCLAEHGHHVICVDKIEGKIAALRAGEVPIYEPGLKEMIDRNVEAKRLSFTTDGASAVGESEVVFIAVGTPPGENGEADLRFVREAAIMIGRSMKGYRVIVNKSTVPVGTTDLVAGIIAENTPYPFDVVSNPEFLREGAAVDDCMHPDRIVIGTRSDRAKEIMTTLYSTFDAPIVVTDPRSAEMIKYASNAFLAVKISFINEIAGLCDLVGADIAEVSRGMGYDPRIGQAFLKAGIGYGGSCFPKDTQALLHIASRVAHRLPILEAATQVNESQRLLLARQAEQVLGGFGGRTVGILGLAFKPNTDDVREAPALQMIGYILDRGGAVRAYDPKATENAKKALLEAGFDLDHTPIEFCPDPISVAQDVDAIILATEWPEFARTPWREILPKMRRPYIFDGRNLLDPSEMHALGYHYRGVGRGQGAIERAVLKTG